MKKILALLLLLATPAFAQKGGTQAQLRADQFALNSLSPATATLGDKLIDETVHTLRAYYSFAVQGAASTAAVNLLGTDGKSAKLPKGAIVQDCLLDFVTATTGGAATTFSVGTGQSASDLKLNLAVASGTGLVACIPVGTAATAIKLTADRTPTLTALANNGLTAGKIWVIIKYVISSTTVP